MLERRSTGTNHFNDGVNLVTDNSAAVNYNPVCGCCTVLHMVLQGAPGIVLLLKGTFLTARCFMVFPFLTVCSLGRVSHVSHIPLQASTWIDGRSEPASWQLRLCETQGNMKIHLKPVTAAETSAVSLRRVRHTRTLQDRLLDGKMRRPCFDDSRQLLLSPRRILAGRWWNTWRVSPSNSITWRPAQVFVPYPGCLPCLL